MDFYGFGWLVCWILLPLISQATHRKHAPQTSKKLKLIDKENCPDRCPECPDHLACPTGVPRIWDKCGCCLSCARQQGEDCGILHPCDAELRCVNGICHARNAKHCKIGAETRKDGETWKPDCQTVCECQNGIFGCTDVCKADKLESECKFGRKLVVESECCSRWECQDELPSCSNTTTEWTQCSCTEPVAHQWTNHNPDCQWIVHQRQCSPQSCPPNTTVTSERESTGRTETIDKAREFCEASLYHRLEFVEEDNCKSTRMLHQRTCLKNCHLADGTKFCCMPNEFASRIIHFVCANGEKVLRTFPVIAGCSCQIC